MESPGGSGPRAPGEPPAAERSLGALFRELAAESSQLLRQELDLAREELRQGVQQVGGAVKQLTLGGAVTVVGVLTLTAFAVVLLGNLLDNYWLGALIVAALLLAVGGFLVHRGIGRLKSADLAPRETVASLRRTGSWAGAEVAELREALGAGSEAGEGGGAAAVPPRVAAGALPQLPAAGESTASRPGHEDQQRARSETMAAEPGTMALLKRVGREFMEDDVLGEAAKVAYYAFLAMPPALLVVFSLTGYFGGNAAAEWINSRLQGALPQEAAGLVERLVAQITEGGAPGPLSVGLLLALWASSNVFMALGTSLNEAYDVEDERSWVKRRAIAIGVMLGAVVLMLVASISLLMGPQIASALNLWGAAEVAWSILQWPLAFLFVAAAFYLIYFVLPGRDQADFKVLLIKAAVAAAALWIVATIGFRIYIANFGSYSATYGIVGTVIVILLWLYVTGVVILAGGELASEMERARAR